MQSKYVKFKTEKEFRRFMRKKGRKPENPPMLCENFRQESGIVPDHCYNCYMRAGYPQYLGGDENCNNFKEKKRCSS